MFSFELTFFRASSAALLMSTLTSAALSQGSASPGTTPSLTYDQALMQAAAADSQAANGYASVGYSPAIFSIPNSPFTAQRVYKEWARNGATQAPAVSTTVTIARDNVGRIHYESSRLPGDIMVRISDPVTHVNIQYEVNSDPTVSTVAQQCTQPLMTQISSPTPDTSASDTAFGPTAATAPPVPATTLPTPSKSELGSKQIEGTLAYGQTRTDYMDLQPGVLTMQTLSWFSPDMGLMLAWSSDYSNQNKFAEFTQNLTPGTPDPSLFALPAGFTLSDSTTSCIPLLN